MCARVIFELVERFNSFPEGLNLDVGFGDSIPEMQKQLIEPSAMISLYHQQVNVERHGLSRKLYGSVTVSNTSLVLIMRNLTLEEIEDAWQRYRRASFTRTLIDLAHQVVELVDRKR